MAQQSKFALTAYDCESGVMRADTAILLLSTFLLTLPCNCNRKDELNKILADFKLEFSPDDNSPVDPIKTLRDAIQAGSQEDAFKKSDIARNKRGNSQWCSPWS